VQLAELQRNWETERYSRSSEHEEDVKNCTSKLSTAIHINSQTYPQSAKRIARNKQSLNHHSVSLPLMKRDDCIARSPRFERSAEILFGATSARHYYEPKRISALPFDL